jgi:uncharacterized membrane protein
MILNMKCEVLLIMINVNLVNSLVFEFSFVVFIVPFSFFLNQLLHFFPVVKIELEIKRSIVKSSE